MTNVINEGWLTFKSIFTGMGVTLRHLFQPAVTELYPEQKVELPAGARAKLYVHIDDCIGCSLCERACPVNCITIDKVKATADVDLGTTSTGNPKRFWITQFDIDMAKCMYCDLCTYPCPTECIYMVPEYEYSEYDRANLLYRFSELGPGQVAEVKEKAEREAEEQQRKKERAREKKAGDGAAGSDKESSNRKTEESQ